MNIKWFFGMETITYIYFIICFDYSLSSLITDALTTLELDISS